jgi:2-iminobutanoate/2-iminopropanoate deaminase
MTIADRSVGTTNSPLPKSSVLTTRAVEGVHEASGYSHVTRIGDLLFVSGQVALDAAGELVGGADPVAQTEQAIRNLRTILVSVGSDLDRVGKLTVYAIDPTHRAAILSTRDRIFGALGHAPASTFVVVRGLVLPEWLVEIEAIAVAR